MLDPEHLVTDGPEPAYCPLCGLRHMRRPDWLCPRCGAPVETGAPQATTRVAPPPPERFPIGTRVAGGLMTVAGLALVWGFARNPAAEHRWAVLAAAASLVVLGTGALVATAVARWVAAIAGALAALVVAEDLVRARFPDLFQDVLPGLLRAPLRDLVSDLGLVAAASAIAFAAGALLLLVARPGRARAAAGVALALPAIAVALLRALGR